MQPITTLRLSGTVPISWRIGLNAVKQFGLSAANYSIWNMADGRGPKADIGCLTFLRFLQYQCWTSVQLDFAISASNNLFTSRKMEPSHAFTNFRHAASYFAALL